MKKDQKHDSYPKDNRAIEKLLNEPNSYDEKIAEKSDSDVNFMLELIENQPEQAFKQGVCHIYAICLKNTDSRFVLHVITGPSGQDGKHVYCKIGEFAIDVDGVQLESDLIEKWKRNSSEILSSCEVTESELMQPDKDRSKAVNMRRHLLHETIVRKAIDKAEAHIAQHLPGWRDLLARLNRTHVD
jgi:hypothetical protein